MTFRFDKLTNKSQSLLLDAESRAGKRQNPEITPLHLLDAMLEESDGIMRPSQTPSERTCSGRRAGLSPVENTAQRGNSSSREIWQSYFLFG